jgi:hypothetical protein
MSAASPSIRILAVDDHPLFRQGIAALLAPQPDMSLVAEVGNTCGTWEALSQQRACWLPERVTSRVDRCGKKPKEPASACNGEQGRTAGRSIIKRGGF